MYLRAVDGIRALLALAEGADPDVVCEVLVRELTAALAMDSVIILASEQPASKIIELSAAPGRRVVLECASLCGRETVTLAPHRQRGLDREEVEIAAAIVEAAAVVLRLYGAQRDAATDELTGCLNRRAMLRRLEEETARAQREEAPLAVVMLDLDNLKQINDTFGHLEGDRVLRDVGRKLRAQLRRYDIAARYGGDEFLILLPATTKPAAIRAATRMTTETASIRTPAIGRQDAPISITFATVVSRPGDTASTLLDRVDRALLHAKDRTHRRHRSHIAR